MSTASTRKHAPAPQPASDWPEFRKSIASFFRDRREACKMTLQQTAELSGVTVEQLEKYEAGAEAMPLDLIFSLTNLYNIPPEDTLNLIYDVYGEQGRK